MRTCNISLQQKPRRIDRFGGHRNCVALILKLSTNQAPKEASPTLEAGGRSTALKRELRIASNKF